MCGYVGVQRPRKIKIKKMPLAFMRRPLETFKECVKQPKEAKSKLRRFRKNRWLGSEHRWCRPVVWGEARLDTRCQRWKTQERCQRNRNILEFPMTTEDKSLRSSNKTTLQWHLYMPIIFSIRKLRSISESDGSNFPQYRGSFKD